MNLIYDERQSDNICIDYVQDTVSVFNVRLRSGPFVFCLCLHLNPLYIVSVDMIAICVMYCVNNAKRLLDSNGVTLNV